MTKNARDMGVLRPCIENIVQNRAHREISWKYITMLPYSYDNMLLL